MTNSSLRWKLADKIITEDGTGFNKDLKPVQFTLLDRADGKLEASRAIQFDHSVDAVGTLECVPTYDSGEVHNS